MGAPNSGSRRSVVTLGVVLGVAGLLGPRTASGQGCSPSRFAAPDRFGQGDIYLSKGLWQVGLTYRRFASHNLIQGHDDNSVTAPHGNPSAVESQTLTFSVGYAVNDRLSLTINAPFLHGTHTTWYPDSLRHSNSATGLGETTVIASYWLRRAKAVSPGGNVAVGVGLKTPTGKNDVRGRWWNQDGSTIPFPVHQSIQLGDGGWGVILQVLGFQPILDRAYLYAAGAYTVNPKKTTDVVRTPGSPVHWAVPDTWSADGGLGMALWPEEGLTVGLNLRLGGATRRDLVGGKDAGHRLPATTGYLTPTFSIGRGRHLVEVAFQVLVYRSFLPSYVDIAAGKLGGGGLASREVLVGYSARF